MPASLTVCGPFRGYSGYDRTVRGFVRQLTRAGVRVGLVDLPGGTPLLLPERDRDRWFETLTAPVESSAALHFCMPHRVRPLPGRLNANFTMFEATRIPPAWIVHNRRHDLVILPTESSLHAWVGSGFPGERLRLCPIGVDVERFRPGLEPLELIDRRGRRVADYRVRVLNVSEIGPRKNLLTLLRVWIEATRATDDAVLIVKLSVPSPLVLLKLLRELALAERDLGRCRDEAAPVLLVDRVLADDEMPRLYAAATHYWSMSAGEGWDQPMAEAAASGLGLIAPDHSAYRAYLDDTVAWMIPSRPVPARCPHDAGLQALFEGAQWWHPDAAAAAEHIRRVIAGQPAPDARARMVGGFTWGRATARLIEVLDELHAVRGRLS